MGADGLVGIDNTSKQQQFRIEHTDNYSLHQSPAKAGKKWRKVLILMVSKPGLPTYCHMLKFKNEAEVKQVVAAAMNIELQPVAIKRPAAVMKRPSLMNIKNTSGGVDGAQSPVVAIPKRKSNASFVAATPPPPLQLQPSRSELQPGVVSGTTTGAVGASPLTPGTPMPPLARMGSAQWQASIVNVAFTTPDPTAKTPTTIDVAAAGRKSSLFSMQLASVGGTVLGNCESSTDDSKVLRTSSLPSPPLGLPTSAAAVDLMMPIAETAVEAPTVGLPVPSPTTQPPPATALASTADAPAEAPKTRRRVLKRGNNEVKTAVLPEWTQAQESLDDLDSFLSGVECIMSPEPPAADADETAITASATTPAATTTHVRVSKMMDVDTTESSSEELTALIETKIYSPAVNRVVSALIFAATSPGGNPHGSWAADTDVDEVDADDSEYNLLEDQGEYNLIEDNNGRTAVLGVETATETESCTDSEVLSDIESCTDGSGDGQSRAGSIALKTVGAGPTEAELEAADLAEAALLVDVLSPGASCPPRRETAWQKPTVSESASAAVVDAAAPAVAPAPTPSLPNPDATIVVEVAATGVVVPVNTTVVEVAATGAVVSANTWAAALDAAMEELSVDPSPSTMAALTLHPIKGKTYTGRFDFDFSGRMMYTASEVIVDANDWNEGLCPATVDVYPKKKKGIRRVKAGGPAREASDPSAVEPLPVARHGRSFVQKKQNHADV
jgi:hypothetical protein